MSDFLSKARAGLIATSTKHHRISANKGGIAEVRKRLEKSLGDGGFPRLAMTGASTALSAAPEEGKIIIDVEIQDEHEPAPAPETPESTPKDILHGSTRKEKPKELLPGRVKSETEAEPPKTSPPFFLPAENASLNAWKSYYVDRYGKNVGLRTWDDMAADSKAFTATVKALRQLNKQINSFNKNDAARWAQWAHNLMVDFGDDIIGALGFAGDFSMGAKAVTAGVIITQIKELLKAYKPSTKNDFVKTIKSIQARLLEGRPHWKAKLNQMATLQFDDFMKKMDPEDPRIDRLPDGKQKEMERFY